MSALKAAQSDSTDALIERIPDNLLLEPVEYIFADHCRQADVCEVLRTFAARYCESTPDIELAAALGQYLGSDLSLHIADEEMDLFPRLGNRALNEDHFPDLLRLLDQEHERDRILTAEVHDGLTCIARGEALKDGEKFRIAAVTLATTHLIHVKWENATVLPLARKRLSDEDLEAMGHTMAARRSIAYPGN